MVLNLKRSVDKLTKHLSILRSIRYNCFSKCNSIREDLINKKHSVKRSSVRKSKRMYSLISDSLKVMIQE